MAFYKFIVVDDADNEIVEYYDDIEDAKSLVEYLMHEEVKHKGAPGLYSIYMNYYTPKFKVVWE